MSYTPTNWQTGDTVTAERLNKIEGAITEFNSEIDNATFITKTNEIVDAIEETAGEYDLTDYKSITAAVRNGDGDKVPNGQVFTVPHTVYGNIDFVVRRKNVDKVVGDPDRPTLTFQSKYLLSPNAGTSVSTFQYDRPEAFKKVTDALAANTVCKFTAIGYGGWTAGTYHFTATSPIAANSVLCINGYQNTPLTSLKVQVFDSVKSITASASYDIVSGDGSATVNLGTWGTDCNHPQRVSYGSNNEAEANITQWLNGDSGSGYMDSIFVPKTKYDMMCTSFTSLKGFLGGFPSDFRECLGLCSVHNLTNDVYESDDSSYSKSQEYTHSAYFWLPSRKEIYGTNENSREASETQFPYYEHLATSNADKLMYAKGASSPTTYWLRTPYASYAVHVRICYTGGGGALYNYDAYYSYGVAPLGILT